VGLGPLDVGVGAFCLLAAGTFLQESPLPLGELRGAGSDVGLGGVGDVDPDQPGGIPESEQVGHGGSDVHPVGRKAGIAELLHQTDP
jgi:hypothetical protein